jgi:hypothetical protein
LCQLLGACANLGKIGITKKHFLRLSMKTPSLALLNSIGFTTPAQKLLYAASLLKAATLSSPAVQISPAVPAVVAKLEVIAQTAKPARPASAAVEGGVNPGHGFGELYLNSPPYPAGTPIPAIPAKPASAAVVGIPGVAAVAAIPAIVAPAVVALKGWEDAIVISSGRVPNTIDVVVSLPVNSSGYLIGAEATVNEITPTTLSVDSWLDNKASMTAETITNEPPTLEQYFYKYAKYYLVEHSTVGSITKSTKLMKDGVIIPVKKITLSLAVTNYDYFIDSLQLDKVNIL